MNRLVPAVLALALLAGCESTSGAPPVGASDVRIDAEHYRTTFRGVSGASPQEIEDRALLHAANLALGQGYDWFRITNRSGGFAAPTSPQFTFGIGGASFGPGSAIGIGGSRTVGGEPTYVADLELVLGKGPKPADPQVYDARSVVASLGPRLAPPPPTR